MIKIIQEKFCTVELLVWPFRLLALPVGSYTTALFSSSLHGISNNNVPFLGAFAKLQKATIIFAMEKAGSHWTDFHEI
jgi:hypothetical protein